jgi:hypothetical protein
MQVKKNQEKLLKCPGCRGEQHATACDQPHINMLWTADFMHGPYLTEGRKKRKTYLCVIIDDYSRVLVGAAFFFEESSLSLQITFREAVLTPVAWATMGKTMSPRRAARDSVRPAYGIPHRLYCDYTEKNTMPKNILDSLVNEHFSLNFSA